MQLKYFFTSSVGKKYLVGLTGLGLSGFIVTHVAGNMLILYSAEAYNKYSYTLVSNLLLPVAEIGLLLLFVVHLYYALSLNLANRAARGTMPQKPERGSPKFGNFASRSMVYTGLLTLVFLVLHLITFKWGAHYTVNYGGVEMRDIHKLVLEKFHEPLYVGWYVFSLIVLFVHLSHGLAATMQSTGLQSVRNARLKKAGWAIAAVIAAGFISQPIYVFLGGH